MDEKVRRYLVKQNINSREIIEVIRNLILFYCPKIKETAMNEGLWYEGKFYLTSIKDHVNLGIGINGLTDNEIRNFEGTGKTMRHLKFFSKKDINETKLVELLKLVYTKTTCAHDVMWK